VGDCPVRGKKASFGAGGSVRFITPLTETSPCLACHSSEEDVPTTDNRMMPTQINLFSNLGMKFITKSRILAVVTTRWPYYKTRERKTKNRGEFPQTIMVNQEHEL
jgi:hypothetical protein